MLRLVALILLALLLALGVKLWAGEWGLREIARLRAQIEERARTELGLIKSDEVFYQVVEPAPGDKKKDDGGH